jgi:3-hydroxyisobutyrate dehydrogenase-like beta-hydroxyacid dehydrogenase
MATAAGLDLHLTHQAVGARRVPGRGCGQLLFRRWRRDYSPGFMVRLHAKDLRLADELFRELGLTLRGPVFVTNSSSASL